MTELLYMKDSYLAEFGAIVSEVGEDEKGSKWVVLDQTGFYPQGGGQPSDIGVLKFGDKESRVTLVKKDFTDVGKIKHYVNGELPTVGTSIDGMIDWELRYAHMRAHTAAHLFSTVVHKDTGALITGNQITAEKVRIDFNAQNFDKERIGDYVSEANQLIKKDLPVGVYYMKREEASKSPEMFKLANKLPPVVKELRIVTIGDFDKQPDGGTHVKSLKELRELKFLKCDNRGANNKRIYFILG